MIRKWGSSGGDVSACDTGCRIGGRGCQSPEIHDLRALGRRLRAIPDADYGADSPNQPAQARAARAATLEWVRCGSHAVDYKVATASGGETELGDANDVSGASGASDDITVKAKGKGKDGVASEAILDIIARYESAIPARLRPWLGDPSAASSAGLPVDMVLSASRVFEPMTHCSYKLFWVPTIPISTAKTASSSCKIRGFANAELRNASTSC
jgi:hypothetical protein